MKRKLTTLTDATLITAVVQTGYGEIITDALLEVAFKVLQFTQLWNRYT